MRRNNLGVLPRCEQRSEDAGLQRLHKRSETGNVGKKGRNLAALPAEVDGVRVGGKLLGKEA